MILVAFGTRPEFIKIKPVLKKLKKYEYKILFTGQHEDLLRKSLNDLKIRKRKILRVKKGSNRLDSIVVSVLNNESIFRGVNKVLVQGDTTSAFAVALAAYHRNISVYHLEAGLRSYDIDNPRPEEFNRRAISCLSSFNFCPTEESLRNLQKENLPGENIVTGNTVLDNLVDVPTSYSNKIVITLHRRENLDLIKQWFQKIEDLAIKYSGLDFVFPMHPNPNIKKHSHILKNVTILDAIEHDEFIDLLANCKFTITDSGGIQEESAFLKKKCLICRKTTERPEGLGVFSKLVHSPEDLPELFEEVFYNYVPKGECPYGDGHASDMIVEYLRS